MAKLSTFLPSIDNLSTNVKDVHSLMIVPIFGHKEKFEQKYKSSRGPKQMPIAIL